MSAWNFAINAAASSGVITAPSTVSIAEHIRGHKASFSENTDTWSTYKEAAELFGLRNNLKMFCFAETSVASMNDAYTMGAVDFGWYDGIDSSILAGLATRRGGRPVTAVSYLSGTDDNKLDYLPIVLSGRNSQYETTPLTNIYTGLTDVELISQPSTIRMGYYSMLGEGKPDFIEGTFQQGLDNVTAYVADTITKNGWYTNFNHWHWWLEDYAKNYLAHLGGLLDIEDVYHGSYSDIGEYYFVREAVDSISYSNGTVNITYSKKYPNSPYDKITTPLWVKVDLSNTALSGKDITTSHGGKIRSVGGNVYYISIDLDFTLTSASFSISETVTPSYINLNTPVVSRTGNDITSDQPIKITLFSKAKTATYELSVIVEERQLTPATSFTLATTLDTVNRDYYLGFMNAEGISGTLEF